MPVDLEPFLAAGDLLYGGAFVAERFAAVGPFVESNVDAVDPVVASIILAAGRIPAWRLAQDRDDLARLTRATERAWVDCDVLVVPSVPRLPTLAEVLADPLGPNAMLGTYTNFVNLLGLCALTMPVEPDESVATDRPPFSVTLIGPAWADGLLVSMARRISERDSPAILRTPP